MDLWRRVGRSRSVDAALMQTIGLRMRDLDELYAKTLRRRYWPSYADLEEAAEIAAPADRPRARPRLLQRPPRDLARRRAHRLSGRPRRADQPLPDVRPRRPGAAPPGAGAAHEPVRIAARLQQQPRLRSRRPRGGVRGPQRQRGAAAHGRRGVGRGHPHRAPRPRRRRVARLVARRAAAGARRHAARPHRSLAARPRAGPAGLRRRGRARRPARRGPHADPPDRRRRRRRGPRLVARRPAPRLRLRSARRAGLRIRDRRRRPAPAAVGPPARPPTGPTRASLVLLDPATGERSHALAVRGRAPRSRLDRRAHPLRGGRVGRDRQPVARHARRRRPRRGGGAPADERARRPVPAVLRRGGRPPGLHRLPRRRLRPLRGRRLPRPVRAARAGRVAAARGHAGAAGAGHPQGPARHADGRAERGADPAVPAAAVDRAERRLRRRRGLLQLGRRPGRGERHHAQRPDGRQPALAAAQLLRLAQQQRPGGLLHLPAAAHQLRLRRSSTTRTTTARSSRPWASCCRPTPSSASATTACTAWPATR